MKKNIPVKLALKVLMVLVPLVSAGANTEIKAKKSWDFLESIGMVARVDDEKANKMLVDMGVRYIRGGVNSIDELKAMQNLYNQSGMRFCMLWDAYTFDKEMCHVDWISVNDPKSGEKTILQAEEADEKANLIVDETIVRGTQKNSFLKFSNVDFGNGGREMEINWSIAPENEGGWVSVLIDGRYRVDGGVTVGTILGSPSTGGKLKFETRAFENHHITGIDDIKGVHDVYILFHSLKKLDLDRIDSWLNEIETHALDACAAIEGPNEYDNLEERNPNWLTELKHFQATLYQKVKSHPNPKMREIPVVAPSLVGTSKIVGTGDWTGISDKGCLHPYTSQNPAPKVEKALSEVVPAFGTTPIWATEIGYHSALKRERTGNWTSAPMNDSLRAKYLLRTFAYHFDFRKPGIPFYEKTFKFKFQNQHPDPDKVNPVLSWGIVDHDYSPRKSYSAVKNLIGLLQDDTGDFTPGELDISLSDTPEDMQKILLANSDGRYHLIIWREVLSFDNQCYNDKKPYEDCILETIPVNVTISVNEAIEKFTAFRPAHQPDAFLRVTGKKQVEIPVADNLVVLEIEPENKQVDVQFPGKQKNHPNHQNVFQVNGKLIQPGFEHSDFSIMPEVR